MYNLYCNSCIVYSCLFWHRLFPNSLRIGPRRAPCVMHWSIDMANSSTAHDPSLHEDVISDIQMLFSELLPAATNWKRIGLALHCPLYRLQLIESKLGNRDASHFLLDMLDYRLKCTTPSYLSWKEVCYALREKTVSEERLAWVIAQKHCPHILEDLKRTNPLAELSSISGEFTKQCVPER